MSHTTWAIGSEIVGYRLLCDAGRDLFGDVYLAQNADDRQVAIRTLDPALAANRGLLMDFYQAAKFGMSVDYPGVLKVLEVGQAEDGRHFVVTEFLGAENLKSRLGRLGPLAEAEAVRLVDQLAEVLEALHEDPDRPVVHRALMPANVVLDAEDKPVLSGMQWGSPTRKPLPYPAHGLTAELFQYLAPEQIFDRHQSQPAADVYSLGALFYTLLTAKIPFKGQDADETRRKKLALDFEGPETLVPGLSRGVVQIIRDCLQPEPHRRPSSMKKLREYFGASGCAVGQYRLQSYLAGSRTGDTYQAVSPTGLPVAIKLVSKDITIDPLRLQRFSLGANAAIAMSHSSLLKAYDAGEAAGRHFLVTEPIDGENLAWLIQKHGAVPEPEAIRIAIEIAGGLERIHKDQLVHRGVEPGNVFIQTGGDVKLTGLAFAKCLGPVGETCDPVVDRLDGEACQFVPPEQLTTAKQVDQRGDLYSLGVTLFVLLTGKPPFPPSAATEMLMDKATNAFPTVRQMNPRVSDATSRLVAWLMQADPNRRPTSAESFSQAARECLRRLSASKDNSARKCKKKSRSKPSHSTTPRHSRKRSSRKKTRKEETLGQKLALGLGFLFAAMLVGWLLVHSL